MADSQAGRKMSQSDGCTSQKCMMAENMSQKNSKISAKISFVSATGRMFYFGDISQIMIVRGNKQYFLEEDGSIIMKAKRGGKGCEVSFSTMTNRAREEGLLATSLCGFGSLDTGYVGPLI